ncbi:MAG: GTP-binding protein TypA [Deltaproteobacteria bacterium CG2_30_63_29]|nr:MAG: GTP-binding protein TypA [Deltaproteobacteria bacterium CG2_30_63_29]PIV98827.1 MAG: translational GTPase TypA [Deltaproteobacteria bacterium CG17_big_fil_post_rev_8_21_14_2_50_63_7]PJB44808.1 MAG: translational GTPase TypA [Deltaproteobacteria bacterium CG_4_9_14_3_um_filter_63_12]
MNDKLRNVAIIAHVDHGKTTLVDAMLKQQGRLDDRREVVERVMDSNDLERERGITILGKATSVMWGDVKINIADTPGHADFGGEVERMLTMVDGVLLLVDAAEGPLPQTRFVLSKSLEAGHITIVVINKIDRKDARVEEVLDEIYDLFIDLGADDKQLDFPVLYTNARAGTAARSLEYPATDLKVLFETIIDTIPAPDGDSDAPLAALVTNLDYDPYIGRLALGRIEQGTLREGEMVSVVGESKTKVVRVGQLYVFEGLERTRVKTAPAGELFAVAGIDTIGVGDTIAEAENPIALKRVTVDEPTIAMFFQVNNGPFAGLEGKYITSRHLGERLLRERRANVSLRVEETDSPDTFRVVGRGELALSILIENMRRELFELCVSKPEVVTKRDADGKLLEPMERLVLDLPEQFFGTVTQKLAVRKGRMVDMKPQGSGRLHAEFCIPSRGLIGFRFEYLNDCRGQGIMNTLFDGWAPWHGPMHYRANGAIVSDRTGTTTAYALNNLQPRGILKINPGVEVYEGMIVGEHAKDNDIDVNAVREKKLTNMRSSGKDEAVNLTPVRPMTLEECIEWIDEDELVEVTPTSLRIRKRILQSGLRAKKTRDDKRVDEGE